MKLHCSLPLENYRIKSYEVDDYKRMVIAEMENLGASKQEIALLKDETVRNAMKRGRNPKEVAWAILA